MRQILEAAGVNNILAKSLGSPTHINVAKATVDALKSQMRPDQVAKARGKRAEEIVPPGTDAAPNTPARYLGEIETLEGPGTIEVTIDWGEDPELVPNAVVMATKTARIHIV